MVEDKVFREKRRYGRKPANIRAKYRNLRDLQFTSGTIKNISRAGMLLEGQKYEGPRESVQVLTLDAPDDKMVQATAKVAWSREAKELAPDKVADSFLIGLEVIEKTTI